MPKSAIVIYGPHGCGKTQAAEALRDCFLCDEIIDNWAPGNNQEIPDNALLLTNVKPSAQDLLALGNDAVAISFDLAVEELDE